MVAAWAGYLLMLAAAFLFYLLFTDWLGGYLMALVLMLPWASLLVSLPAALGLQIRLAIHPAEGSRDGQFTLEVQVNNRFRLPVRRLSFRLKAENLLSGGSGQQRCRMVLGSGNQREGFEFTMRDWGVARGSLRFLRAYDYLGLFPIPLKRPKPALALARPLPGEPAAGLEQLAAQQEAGEQSRGDFPEDYSLREYQPGDPLRSIHWKLTSKLDQLIVRQPEGGDQPELILLFELWGQMDRIDRLAEQLEASCRLLWDRGLPCRLVWAGGPDGQQLLEHPAANPMDWENFLWQAGSQAAAKTGKPAAQLMLEADRGLDRTFYLDGLAPKEEEP